MERRWDSTGSGTVACLWFPFLIKNVGALGDTIHSSGVPNLLSENISRSSAFYIRYQNIMRLFSFHAMEFDSILHIHQEPSEMDQAQNLITAPFPVPNSSRTHTAPLDLVVSAPLPLH